MANLKFYTYIYWETPDKPFYVGKGQKDRANTHIKEYNMGARQVVGKVRKLRASGVEPNVEIYHTNNEFAAFWLEKVFIAAYGRRNLGTGPLLNFTDGGEGESGAVRTEEQKKRISTAKKGCRAWNKGIKGAQVSWSKGKSFSDEHKRKLSDAAKRRSADASARKALSERGRLGATVRWGN